ncbi:MAG: hypothetical protein LUQ65_15070 [Candidatus Helarchaeota archaeon]|nr:hypothetical protein [Candidatus Helarchaeota archaeon]
MEKVFNLHDVIDEEVVDMNIIDWIAFWVFFSFIALSFGCFLFFSLKYRKLGEKTKIHLAYLIFFLCWGIASGILLVYDYCLTGLNPAEGLNYMLVWRIASAFLMGAFGSIIFASENGVFKGKDYYGFLIGYLIFFCIGLCHPDFFIAELFMMVAECFALFIPISYIYLAYKFPAARKNIALQFIGFLIFAIGIVMAFAPVVAAFLPLIHELYLVSAIVQILGFSIFAISINRMYFARKT